MKILAFFAAGLIGTAALTPLAANASGQGVVVHERTTVRHVNSNHHRSHWKTVCRTQWRHHHRVRVCHKVRTWR